MKKMILTRRFDFICANSFSKYLLDPALTTTDIRYRFHFLRCFLQR